MVNEVSSSFRRRCFHHCRRTADLVSFQSPAASWGMSEAEELQEKRKKLGQQIRQMGEKFNANGKKWSDARRLKTGGS